MRENARPPVMLSPSKPWTISSQIWCLLLTLMGLATAQSLGRAPLFKVFLYCTNLCVCLLSKIKDEHIKRDFHSVAHVRPRAGTWECLGGGGGERGQNVIFPNMIM